MTLHRPIIENWQPEMPQLPCVCGTHALRSSDGLCYCDRKPDRIDRGEATEAEIAEALHWWRDL